VQLHSLNTMRALAIVLVVLGHADKLGALTIDAPLELVFWNLVSGGTTLFVFLSGFLFHHVSLKKFDSETFLGKKLVRLGLPYLFLSFAALAIGCEVHTFAHGEGWLGELWLLIVMLGTGSAAISYWYIPFILILFAMAPLHVRFARLAMRWQMAIIGVVLVAALFVHRPVNNIGPLQNLIYFTPAYLLGMFCSQHRDQVYPRLAQWTWPLLAATLGLAVLDTVTMSSNYKSMFEPGGVDMMLLQKLSLSLFLLSFLHPFEAWRPQTVTILADTSFAIFFLHPLFIQLFSTNSLVAPLLGQESWPMYFAGNVVCVATCCALAFWFQRVFGPRGQLLTGY
jgi:peptidoglycan/LPS O-acetylase OafA/YrhL